MTMVIRLCKVGGHLPHSAVCELIIEGVVEKYHVSPMISFPVMLNAVRTKCNVACVMEKDVLLYVSDDLMIGREVLASQAVSCDAMELLDKRLGV
jgi:hypothetical protein